MFSKSRDLFQVDYGIVRQWDPKLPEDTQDTGCLDVCVALVCYLGGLTGNYPKKLWKTGSKRHPEFLNASFAAAFDFFACLITLDGFPRWGVPFWGPDIKGIVVFWVSIGVPLFTCNSHFLLASSPFPSGLLSLKGQGDLSTFCALNPTDPIW